MNATYQKSQTTTRVRPIYTVSKGQSRLYVLPAYRKGAVTVRIEHTEGENVKKLCCAIRTNIVLSMHCAPCMRSPIKTCSGSKICQYATAPT